MPLIRKTLPGTTWTKEFSATRAASHVGTGSIAKTAADIVARRMQQRISNDAPFKTGELADSVAVRINLRSEAVKVKTVVYGGYQNEGTPTIAPTHFIDNEVKGNRSGWESDLRATVANLERRAEAAKKKESGAKGRGR